MGPLQRLELKPGMDLPFDRVLDALVYAGRLDKLYQVVQFGHSLVSGLVCFCHAAPKDRVLFFSYSKLWRAIIKLEYTNWADGEDCYSSVSTTRGSVRF